MIEAIALLFGLAVNFTICPADAKPVQKYIDEIYKPGTQIEVEVITKRGERIKCSYVVPTQEKTREKSK